MKAAFAYWNNRIAPVFDIAKRIHVAEAESGRIVAEMEEVLTEDVQVRKALRLAELGVETLVCGAISRPLHAMVVAYGIRVIPFVAGDLGDVIRAWLRGDLDGEEFAMPGCCGRGRHRGINGMIQEAHLMNGRRRNGMGPGEGRGQGRGGQGRGRRGGPGAGGARGICLCPKCGHREPHETGAPCMNRTCPQCGAAMSRE